MIDKMGLPGFTAEASSHKDKAEYKSYHTYNYQKSESISPARPLESYCYCGCFGCWLYDDDCDREFCTHHPWHEGANRCYRRCLSGGPPSPP
jgi:hypothetical protein